MPLSYDPKSVKSGPSEGDYSFKVTNSTEKQFKSNNHGLELVIEFVAGDRILTTWVRYAFTPGGLPYLRTMCEGLGLSFDPPPEASDFLHKSGVAFFERDGKGFLQPVTIHPKKGGQTEAFVSTPAVGDVPF